MKFATKLTLALWVGICLIYGVNGYDRFRREADLFVNDMQRDHIVMGRGLGGAVAEVWEDEGSDRALDLVERANRRESQITIRWVDPDASSAPATRPAAPESATRGVGTGEAAVWIDPVGDQRLYSYVPLRVDGAWQGAIELSESLAPRRDYLEATIVRMALTSGSLALMAGGVAMALGIVFVGRPIRLLAEKARRVGGGDFMGTLQLRQQDELGELAAEMNAMSRRLADANARLHTEMGARISAIEQLRHGERLMTVGKLASGVAHELGTPLNVITQRAKMVATGEVEGVEILENARIIADQSERITRIVRQLLDFARRRTPEMSRHDLAGLAERTIALLTPLARKQGVTLDLDAETRPIEASVDAVQIQQVLTNLVINGVQAMSRGGRLRVHLHPVRRTHNPDLAGPTRDWVCIDVHDEGSGISPDDLPQVFDPFFTTKQIGEGTGLGLSVAYGIVREHGGWIAVASAAGAGSVFSVHLPAAEA